MKHKSITQGFIPSVPGIVCLLVLIIASVPGYSQAIKYLPLPDETQPITAAYSKEQLNFQPPLNVQKTNASPGYSMLLDSIYIDNNLGEFFEYYRIYYTYNEQYQLDTVWRKVYNGHNEQADFDIIYCYNPKGQLVKILDFTYSGGSIVGINDTIYFPTHTINYLYENELLIAKIDSKADYYETNVWANYYRYNAQGWLVQDSSTNNNNIDNIVSYSYNPDGTVAYKYSADANNNIDNIVRYLYNPDGTLAYIYAVQADNILTSLWQYSYEVSDSVHTQYRRLKYFNSEADITPNEIDFDTITTWYVIEFIKKIQDDLGRTLSLERYNHYLRDDFFLNRYKADFSYNSMDSLLSANYYLPDNQNDPQAWELVTQVNNTYDEDGNPLLHEISYYDARTGRWEIDLRKTYYYTPVSNELSLNDAVTEDLVLYPNPVTSTIYLEGDFPLGATYSIYSLSGLLVTQGKLSAQSISIEGIQPGYFLLNVYADDRQYRSGFIKQ